MDAEVGEGCENALVADERLDGQAAERTLERLPQARSELERLRRTLAQIEDDARRDGVPSGQLY